MSTSRTIPVLILFCLLAAGLCHAAEKPADERKQTALGLYVTSAEAYARWQADEKGVHIIDGRTPEEYALIGHAPMAHNIPVLFMTCAFNPASRSYAMQPNHDFVDMVKARFGRDETIMIMCRSGNRSALGVNALAKVGFTHVYSIIDGFEGTIDNNANSSTHGRRLVNGWLNSGLPVTYNLRKSLMYQHDGPCGPAASGQ